VRGLKSSAGPWRIWAAGAPLLVGVLLLQLFRPGVPLDTASLQRLARSLGPGEYLPGEITFLAVAAIHFFACAGAIFVAWSLLRRTPGSARFARHGVAVAAICIALFPLSLLIHGLSADTLTYRVFHRFFVHTGQAPGFVEPVLGLATPLELAILLPSAAGILAVALTAAAANAQLPLFAIVVEAKGRAQAARIAQLSERLKKCLYALALVLVTATVDASLFFHLPANLVLPDKSPDAAALALFSSFASEISLFWGCIYTLTLAVAVGLPILLLQTRVQRLVEPPFLTPAAAERRRQLSGATLLAAGGEQLKFVTAILSPLVAGPLSSFVQAAAKF
jgi:hypothetical protein